MANKARKSAFAVYGLGKLAEGFMQGRKEAQALEDLAAERAIQAEQTKLEREQKLNEKRLDAELKLLGLSQDTSRIGPTGEIETVTGARGYSIAPDLTIVRDEGATPGSRRVIQKPPVGGGAGGGRSSQVPRGRTKEGKGVFSDPMSPSGWIAGGQPFYPDAANPILPIQDKTLGAGEVEKVSSQESALVGLKDAQKRYTDKYTGLYGGVVAPAISKVPVLGRPFRDPDRAVFQQAFKYGLLKFTYGEAGKQLSDPEREAVKDAIDSLDEPHEVFKPKLDAAIQAIEASMARYKETLRGAQRYVPGQDSNPLKLNL